MQYQGPVALFPSNVIVLSYAAATNVVYLTSFYII